MFVVCNINVATAAVVAIGPLLKQNFYPQNVHKLRRNISTLRLGTFEFKLLKSFLVVTLIFLNEKLIYLRISINALCGRKRSCKLFVTVSNVVSELSAM